MTSKQIKKYQKMSLPSLTSRAVYHFNKFIRLRDSTNGICYCISSGQILRVPSANAQAGHYYSAGKYPFLKFNEDNVHLQGKSDNYFNGANLINYRINLIKKIGIKRLEKLEFRVAQQKGKVYRLDRFYLIEICEKYKALNKKSTV